MLPARIPDLTKLQPLAQMVVGQQMVWPAGNLPRCQRSAFCAGASRGAHARHADGAGRVVLLFYNMPYIRAQLTGGRTFYVYGKPQLRKRGNCAWSTPQIESVENSDGTRMLPVYKLTAGLSQNAMRKLQVKHRRLHSLATSSPTSCRDSCRGIPPLCTARCVRTGALCSPNAQVRDQAVRRLSFNELLLLRCYLSQRRSAQQAQRAAHRRRGARAVLAGLGFAPDGAQLRVMQQIRADMAQAAPMSRLSRAMWAAARRRWRLRAVHRGAERAPGAC